jgi:phosphotriesterase-related protein
MSVQTATGSIDKSALGFTLMHEHVFTSIPGLKEAYPQTFDREAVVSEIVDHLAEAKKHGISTVVEPTPFDMGRDVEIVSEVSRRSGVNVVVSTGFYDVPTYFLATKSVEAAADILERDIVEGVGRTGIRVGMIKARIEESLTGEYEYALRTAAKLQRRWGLPLTVHTSSAHRTGLVACSVLEEEGVDPTRVVIGHAGDSANLAYLRSILDRGFAIGMDRFGLKSLLGIDERVEVVATLCGEGYAGQMILSHDCPCYAQILTPEVFASLGGTGGSWNLRTVPEVIVPALRAGGVTDKEIDEMTREVPARLLDIA